MSEMGSGYPTQDWSVPDERDARIAALEAEIAELKARRCETCDCHKSCSIEEVFVGELPDVERGCILYERREG